MTETEQAAAQPKKKVGRSPAYPGTTISVALVKAKALYDQEGKYAAPMSSALKAWGYSEKSSGGREIRAAMRYYGLISIEGDADAGMVKLTPDALAVLLDTRDDTTEKNQLIRKLALNPAIHKKLAARYPDGLASDGNVTHYLVMTEGFNQSAAAELLSQFKITATFSGIFDPDIVKGNKGEDVYSGAEQEGGNTAIADPPAPLKGRDAQPPPPPPVTGKVQIMNGERVVFTEENNPQVYLKLVASGEVDDLLLEALEDFVKRQRKRIKASAGVTASAAVAADPLAQ